MTPSPLSPHLAFIHKRLPEWLASANAGQRQNLKRRIIRSHAAMRRLREALEPVQGIDAYCRPLLEEVLPRWYPEVPVPGIDLGQVAEGAQTRSWFEAALQNFDEDATITLYDSNGGTQRSAEDAKTFVSGIRNLNLGQRYRDHLADHLDTDAFRELLHQQIRTAFGADVLLARLQGHLEARGQTLADTVLAGLAPSAQEQLQCSFVSLYGKPLSGPMIIQLDQADTPECLLYLPGHPRQPLRQYPNRQALARALTDMLWEQSEREFFNRYIAHADQPHIAERLRANLYPSYPYATLQPSPPVLERGEHIHWLKRAFPAPTDLWQETLDKNALLEITATPWRKDAFIESARVQVERRLQDAATLAVPVAQRDAAAQLARIEGWLGVGLTVLNVAGLFVPGLGEALLITGGAQLVDEFLEGVHAANEGDAEAAIGHLFDVFENLAQFAALGAAAEFTEPQGILHDWHLTGSGKQQKLWHGELKPFTQPQPWPAQTLADGQGLYTWEGERWWLHEGRAAQVKQAPEGTWQLAEVAGQRHRPKLLGNGQGTWLLEHERPLAWQPEKLLKRMGPLSEGLDQAPLERALRCSGYDAAPLRKVTADHQPLPALLADSLQALGGIEPGLAEQEPAGAAILAQDFPSLSLRARREILAQARPVDLAQLQRTGRLPLRIAETARLHLREGRISRALARFYHDDGPAADRDTLLFNSLARLPGWAGEVRLELREGALEGELKAEVGEQTLPTKVLVRNGNSYVPYDEQGEALSGEHDIYRAILQALPDSERTALQVLVHQGPELRDALFEQAASDRSKAALDLHMAPVRPQYRLPTRLPGERRIGYRLSGRGHGALTADEQFDQLFPANPEGDRELLRQRLRHQAGGEPGAFARLLDQLRQEYQQLDSALLSWVHDPEGVALGALELRRSNREGLAQRIRSAWRRENPDDPTGTFDHVILMAEAHQLDALPRLPMRLPHVRQLVLNGLTDTSGAELAPFLQAFPGLRALDLADNTLHVLPEALAEMHELQSLDLAENFVELNDSNLGVIVRLRSLRRLNLTDAIQGLPVAALDRLATLPLLDTLQADLNSLNFSVEQFEALARWPALRGLSLGQNEISLNQATRAALARLNQLEILSLYENPLGLAPDLTGWTNLQQLDLEDTGIAEWPAGLEALLDQTPLNMRRFDLSGNDITDAPDLQASAYARSVREGQADFSYSLNDNPFSAEAWQRLERAGLQLNAPAEVGGMALELWPQSLHQHLTTTAQDPAWQPLYNLFRRLPDTADYARSPTGVRARMQQVVQTLAVEEAQAPWGRAQVMQHINDLIEDAGQQCVDQASLLFSEIETDVLVWQGISQAATGDADQAAAVGTAGCLYRQRLLDARVGELYQARVARRRALADASDDAARDAAPPLHADDDLDDTSLTEPDYLLDELEMALHARIHLRQSLHLPPQPDGMMFAYLARLSDATLQRLSQGVVASSNLAGLGQWAAEQSFWQAWLRRLAPQEFEAQAQSWEAASEYFDTLATTGVATGPYTGPAVPESLVAALESEVADVPGLSWRSDGILQQHDLTAEPYANMLPSPLDRVGGVMLRARRDAERTLVATLTTVLMDNQAAQAMVTS